jgi:hypothetical protein
MLRRFNLFSEKATGCTAMAICFIEDLSRIEMSPPPAVVLLGRIHAKIKTASNALILPMRNGVPSK